MRPVMEKLAGMYEQRTGQKVEINTAGSGELLAHIDSHREGDLYVCHDPFLDILMKKFRLGVDGWVLAELTPVIVVQKGNPKNIHGLADLTRPGLELWLTDYKRSTLGRMLKTIFTKAGIDFERFKDTPTNKSGGYVANMVKTRNADAAICWNAVAHLRTDALDIEPIAKEHLPVPGVDTVTSATGRDYYLTPVRVTVATLKCAEQPRAAAGFAEFIASREAAEVFKDFGFTVSQSRKKYENGREITAGRPARRTLRLYAGAGLRRAVDELISQFTRQTGIKVEPDYGGSGILISRARLDPLADLFMPGDVWYVDRLDEQAGLIESKTPISWFVPVIIVRKGNAKNIKGLADFFRKDVTVALGNPKACQVGRIAREIFKRSGLDIAGIDAKQSLTVNELGVWVKMHDVDAAIVWDAIAANIADSVDVIEIPREKNVISRVVVGLMKTSKDKDSARKFIDFMTGRKGQAILKSKGYRTEAP